MKILITGAKGFVGKNIVTALECIQNGKDRIHTLEKIKDQTDLEIVSYDVDSSEKDLQDACQDCDFVFHLAGINRPKKISEFMNGNYGFTEKLLDTLKKYQNACPVMLASSIQASLTGIYKNSPYGRSKLACEKSVFSYAKSTGAKVLVYRFPNLFGKWCKPNYNSVIATFCNNIACNLPIQVNDPDTELELLYIDELVNEMINALNGKEHRCEYDGIIVKSQKNGRFCFVPQIYKKRLGEVVYLLKTFKKYPHSITMPEMPSDSFEKRLFSTYLSYLPSNKIHFPLKMNEDERGSFTELMRTVNCGQFSVNISKPGITKGQHWHHTKWEFFIVVSGHGLIQERRIGTDAEGNLYPVLEFEVTGKKLEAIFVLPGYTHNIINLSNSEDLITFMWSNEPFEKEKPDTFSESV